MGRKCAKEALNDGTGKQGHELRMRSRLQMRLRMQAGRGRRLHLQLYVRRLRLLQMKTAVPIYL